MHRPIIPQPVVLGLITTAILLPIIICVVIGVAALLGAMGDSLGGAVLYRIALGCGVLWVVDLICLLVVVAIEALGNRDEPNE
jgi:hypothetical protein